MRRPALPLVSRRLDPRIIETRPRTRGRARSTDRRDRHSDTRRRTTDRPLYLQRSRRKPQCTALDPDARSTVQPVLRASTFTLPSRAQLAALCPCAVAWRWCAQYSCERSMRLCIAVRLRNCLIQPPARVGRPMRHTRAFPLVKAFSGKGAGVCSTALSVQSSKAAESLTVHTILLPAAPRLRW